MSVGDLETEATDLLGRLIRFRTVNPPGDERAALEHLAAYLSDAGLHTELLGARAERPNLIATLAAGDGREIDGPVLCLLGHVDTVLAEPSEWRHDPWSGDLADGCVWGRGAIDMKSQVAAEAVAAAALARSGWRPRHGALRLVFVADEETGGELGAQWLTSEHPEKVRCDMLLNEGAGAVFELGGRRRYGVCCGEKGVFRFTISARGTAGHASLPGTADNALLKLAPVLARLGAHTASLDITEGPAALLRAIGEDPAHPERAVERLRREAPALAPLLEPMFGVTLTPTMASASAKVNVIPSRAQIRVDCRVPPGRGEDAARRAIDEVLGELPAGVSVSFDEQVSGNLSPVASPLMEAIAAWVAEADPGAQAVPVILPGFSDSRWFRSAFPECVAYGFFPHRHMSWPEASPLMHNADERIDVRDLGFAARCYADLTRTVLG